jgi:hypothetical protein
LPGRRLFPEVFAINTEACLAETKYLVNEWFAKNTFHSHDFANVETLLALKEKQGVTISLGLPALNEEATVGNVIDVLKGALADEAPLLDEIVVFDSSSTDRTVESPAGASPSSTTRTSSRSGRSRKGEALEEPGRLKEHHRLGGHGHATPPALRLRPDRPSSAGRRSSTARVLPLSHRVGEVLHPSGAPRHGDPGLPYFNGLPGFRPSSSPCLRVLRPAFSAGRSCSQRDGRGRPLIVSPKVGRRSPK